MSLFSPNFTRPGKGIEKDDQELTGIVKFFTVFYRRTSKFMQLNLIFMIPFLCAALLSAVIFFLPVQRYTLELAITANVVHLSLWELYVVPIPFFLLSPFYVGMMVVAKRLANEEYSFIWSEYWQGVKDNWKQGLMNGIMMYVAYAALSFAAVYYYNGRSSEEWYGFIPLAAVFIVALLLILAELYIPLMIASVELNFYSIFKNSLILGIMGLLRNILTIVIIAVLVFALYMMQYVVLTLLIALALIALLFFSFSSYVIVYRGYPMINDYIIAPYEKKLKADKEPEESLQEDEETSDKEESIKEEDEEPEYVYYNGKLVKREELQEDLED